MRAARGPALFLAPTLARTLAASWRFREVEPDGTVGPARTRAAGAIYALWHAQLLPQALLHRHEDLAVLISRHRDGEILARVLQRLGYQTVRGSSSRGGSPGLLEMIRAAREGRPLAITPDGPRGPARRCKPGIVHASSVTGLPIIPIGAAARRALYFRGWDEFLVPLPGAVVYIGYGEALLVPPDLPKEEMPSWQGRIERAIDEVTARCETAAGMCRSGHVERQAQ